LPLWAAPTRCSASSRLGLDTYPVADADEARVTFRRLTHPELFGSDEKFAIIYMEEKLSLALQHEIAQFKDKVTPAVILIPGRDGSLGLGLTALHEAVSRAVGADIL